MKPFVHLHNHTAYSLLDGAGRISDEVKRAVELEMPALALTDHGVMYGAVEFYRACKAAGIKPIIGCEVYVAPRTRFDKESKVDASPYHLILLVKNETGYRNICKLVSMASIEGFYYHPRVDREILAAHHEGLIAMSACLGGEVPRRLMQDDMEGARAAAQWYKDLFGEDYYFELQYHGIPEQVKVNAGLRQLSREMGVKLVATNDNHYVYAEDAAVQDVMLCIQTGTTLDAENRMRFSGKEYYFKSYDEMLRMLPEDREALDETVRVAEKCDFDFTLGHNYMPNFETPPGEDDKAYLRRLCEEGIASRYGQRNAAIDERLDYELGIIDHMGYNTYFLIVWDFVNYAKSHDIFVGPGRGSAAGSIVSYLLGITDIDPLKYQLLFERFLNPERVSMPDIDIDFCYERRGEVIDYVARKYGADHVTQIITFGSMLAKGAVRDVGRVMNVPLSLVGKVCKLIPNELGMTIDKAISASDELRALMDEDEEIARMIHMAKKLEGLPRNAGTHAAGVVISADPVDHYLPLQKTKDDVIITQYPKDDVEAIGLLKMDFLGLRTLTVVNKTVASIKKRYGVDIALDKIPEDDAETYQMLSDGESIGVFQLEGSGLRAILKELQPNNLEDIIALVALYRPGPLGSGMVEDFIARKHGEQEISYLDPKLETILDTTYGVILYQEQVMQIASRLSGFTLGEADMLRRAMGKKKPEIIAGYKTQFIDGAEKNGTPRAVAQKIFELIEYFAGYGFNKSHSAAYGLLAYQTAWLKCHYAKEFMAETLNSFIDRIEKVTFYIEECRHLGIPVLPPDINASGANFTATDEGIRFGMCAIKSVGQHPVELICQAREEATFVSFQDFCTRVELGGTMNKRVIENLIKCGAFDSLGQGTRALLSVLDDCFAQGQQIQKMRNSNQMSLFDFVESPSANEVTVEIPEVEEFAKAERLRLEKELLGIYVSGHPLEEYVEQMKQIASCRIEEIGETMDNANLTLCGLLTNIRMQTTKKGELMAYGLLSDLQGDIDLLIFPRTLPKVRDQLEENKACIVTGRVNIQDEDKKIFVETIAPLKMGNVDPAKAPVRAFVKISPGLPYHDEDVLQLLSQEARGEVPVFLFYTEDSRVIVLKETYWVNDDPGLWARMRERFGPENVNIKKQAE
ncbi:MAG: DNA polymerase III subunit alpha [Peptococcaceae bacterium]|nr:DNA polymerase III subunit alpha [Peptococcaceae bacterium]